MYRVIPDFPDYAINEKGEIRKILTNELIKHNYDTVSLKSESGLWKNRSIHKLLYSTFYTTKLVATPIKFGETVQVFDSIKQAAEWLINTKQAISAGRLAAYQTVRTNIRRGILQPNLYPYVYGYSWKTTERSD